MKISSRKLKKFKPYFPRTLETVEHFSELRRYLIRRRIKEQTARSFVTLLNKSEYSPENSTFAYNSTRPEKTESRLRNFAEIGLIWTEENSEDGNKYKWTLTGKLHPELLGKIIELKSKE